jgi:hypothetical protein
MVYKLTQPEDILLEAHRLYPKGFHEVSDSGFMDEYYRRGAIISGIREYAKTAKEEVHVLDVAAGRGRQGYFVNKVGEENSKKVVIHEVDISRVELGKGRERTIADIHHLPYADKSMNFVFMNNIPVPLSAVSSYVIRRKGDYVIKERMLEMLELATDAIYKLNLLEGARVLKDDGVMVLGGKYIGQKIEEIQKNIEDLPLKVDKFEVVELEEYVVPLWRNYGVDIDKPTFMLASLKKTGSDIQKLVDLYEQVLYTALEQLMRIEEFDGVMKEMRAKKNFKE